MNVRDLIEQPSRAAYFDELAKKFGSEPWVRDDEALASIAISLKRIADIMAGRAA